MDKDGGMEKESEPKAARFQRLCRLCLECDVQMLLVWREGGLVFLQSVSKRFEKVTRGTTEAYLGRNEGLSEQDSNKAAIFQHIFCLLRGFFWMETLANRYTPSQLSHIPNLQAG